MSRRLSRAGEFACGLNLAEIWRVKGATSGREMHRIEWHVKTQEIVAAN